MSLKILVFLGSVRDSTPPRPRRLGERVAKACVARLAAADIEAELIDPLALASGNGEFPAVFKPHFAYAEGRAPEPLERLAETIRGADGYVMVSPEYNHAMSPALADLLNHFGSSRFSYKPSAIVTYSAGQWGGARAAVNMRTFLAELGCLPVSAMIHLSRAQEVLDEAGDFLPEVDAPRWAGYFGRTLAQLQWWAEAVRRQRAEQDPEALAPAFRRDPSQRNAP
ncbi:NADPH-dependent FMN reductase [Halomonas salifodinae]|uniref:NADPH-dependent FMN reductase n=1 Tax=Halomonas salifodinae TaxID=438745 RepID=A0ABW2EXP4_9GAMM